MNVRVKICLKELLKNTIKKDVESDSWLFKSKSDEYKTLDMCEKVIERERWLLKYAPYGYEI